MTLGEHEQVDMFSVAGGLRTKCMWKIGVTGLFTLSCDRLNQQPVQIRQFQRIPITYAYILCLAWYLLSILQEFAHIHTAMGPAWCPNNSISKCP